MSNGIDLITLALARKGGGGGGTSDYTRLSNLPKINGTTITGNLDADSLGLANCKYYTLVVDETNKFVDADGTEIAIADVYRDMAQFVSEDKSNIAVINVTFADEDEETGHTSVFGKLMYTGIDTDEGGLQFYARLGNVEATVLVTEDEVTFNRRDVDFIVTCIVNTSNEVTDLSATYQDIMDAYEAGSNIKIRAYVQSEGAVYELNNMVYVGNDYVSFNSVNNGFEYIINIDSSGAEFINNIIQNKYNLTTITLLSSAWTNNTQTVSVEGMVSDALVQVSPVASDVDAYANAKIVCTAQGNGTLTFSCGSVPTSNLSVTVVNWG